VSLTVVGGAVSTAVTVRLTVIGGIVSARVEVSVIISTTFEITVIVRGCSISTSVNVTVAVVVGVVFTNVEVSVTTLGAFVFTEVQVEVMVTGGGGVGQGVVGDVKNTLTSLELVTVTTSVWVLEQVGPSRVVENTVRIDVLVVVDALQVGGGSSYSSALEIPHSPQSERQPLPQYSAELPQKPCLEQHFPQPDPLQETPSPQEPSRLTAALGEARELARARLE